MERHGVLLVLAVVGLVGTNLATWSTLQRERARSQSAVAAQRALEARLERVITAKKSIEARLDEAPPR